MPYIKVNTNKINQYSSVLASTRAKINNIYRDLTAIENQIDSDVKRYSNSRVKKMMDAIESDLKIQSNSLKKMDAFMDLAVRKYNGAEQDNREENWEYDPNSSEQKALIEEIANQVGVKSGDIAQGLRDKAFSFKDIVDVIEEKAEDVNKFVKFVSSASKFVVGATKFTPVLSKGKMILSNFKRKGLLNNVVKIFNKGKGLGTNYRLDKFGKTAVGKIYNFTQKAGDIAKKVDKVVDKIGKVADVVEAVVYAVDDVVDATGKIKNIWADKSKSKHDKICETTAVGITSAAGLALDVAAPFVGTAVATAIPIPFVNAAVGALVTEGMHLVSDVITSEAVVGAVSSGVKAVSKAGQQLLQSKNAGEAIVNTAKLVGTAVSSTVNTVATVAVETAKAVGKAFTNAAKSVGNWFKKW